jgi:uncharacterized protein with LGFP repeats
VPVDQTRLGAPRRPAANPSRRRSRPGWLAALTAVALALTLGVASGSGPAAAADKRQFDPGMIISDSVFFNYNAMNRQQIADFIAAKGSGCTPGSDGTPCLKDYRQDTTTRSVSGCAGQYAGAGSETAAAIIDKVAKACGINPQVILVLLQKEQSLLTASGSQLRSTRYRSATGYGCPDTAPCDAEYFGFFNQVLMAARQFQLYAQIPTRYSYRAGRSQNIGFHPNASCLSSSVYIRNTATAGLYNYTPYQPNAAILQGSGDSCSSYGNLNFYTFFTDWFGPPGADYPLTGEFLTLWNAIGGGRSVLGYPTSPAAYGLRNGGAYQDFVGVSIYTSTATGAHYVTSPFHRAWGRVGWEGGVLGYPISDPIGGLKDGGSFQNFQGGAIHSSPSTGAYATRGTVYALWAANSWEAGFLGYPTSDQNGGLRAGGSYQDFQGGSIYTSPGTGTHAVPTVFHRSWGRAGWENGVLGYPVTEVQSGLRDGGSYQDYTGGAIYSTPSTGTHYVTGAYHQAWGRTKWENGVLGYPTTDLNALGGGGSYQDYVGGSIYSSPSTGTHSVTKAFHQVWGASGWENGTLGYPTTDLNPGLRDGGSYQDFAGGSIYSSAAGTYAVPRTFHQAWGRTGWENGTLGYPIGPVVGGLRDGGSFQNFQGGAIHYSPATGAHATRGAVYALWASKSWEAGVLGYPTTDLNSGLRDGGTYQDFAGGSVYTSPSSGTHSVLRGPVWDIWSRSGWENGSWGYPVGEATTTNGVMSQAFQGGVIYVRVS